MLCASSDGAGKDGKNKRVAIRGKISAWVVLERLLAVMGELAAARLLDFLKAAGQRSQRRHPIGTDGAEVLTRQDDCVFPVFHP